MWRKLQTFLISASALVFVAATAAKADVTISSDATQNMNCLSGICEPTAANAVLNTGDLDNMLAAGNVTVTTAGTGVEAKNIHVDAAVAWSSASVLTLEAFGSLTIDRPISAEALAGLTLTTNKGGTGGTVLFDKKGRVTFGDPSSNLTINTITYKLVTDLKTLASDIALKP